MWLFYDYFWNYKGFYFWEFFYVLCQAWCHLLVQEKVFLEKLFTMDAMKIQMICKIIVFTGFPMGLFVGWLADSYLGRCRSVMYGQFIALIAPFFLTAAVIVQQMDDILRMTLIYLTATFLVVFLSFQGVRNALLLDQLNEYDESSTLVNNYIMIILIQRELAVGVGYAILQFFPGSSTNYFYYDIVVFMGCLAYAIVFALIKKKLVCEGGSSTVNNAIKCIFSAIKNRSNTPHNKPHWLEHAGTRYNMNHVYIAKVTLQLIVTLLPLFFFNTAEFVLMQVTSKYKIHLLTSDNIISIIGMPTTLYIFKIIALPVIFYVVSPLFRLFDMFISFLQRIGVGYLLVGSALITVAIMEYSMQNNEGSRYVEGYGTVMFFNGMSSNLSVMSRWDMIYTNVPAFSLKVFSKVPITLRKTLKQLLIKETDEIISSWKINVEDMKTISYVYTEQYLRRVPGTFQANQIGVQTIHSNLFLIFSEEIFDGLLEFSAINWRFVKQISNQTKEYDVFFHPFGRYNLNFYLQGENCSDETYIKEELCAIFVFKKANRTFCPKLFSLHKFYHRELNLVIIPLLLLAFGDGIVRSSTLQLTYFQTPNEVRAITSSIIFVIINANTCTLIIELCNWGKPISISAFALLVCIYILTFLMYVNCTIKCEIEEPQPRFEDNDIEIKESPSNQQFLVKAM